ncbi:hypothetical protein N9L68_07745, partial [bacterium]|nr:hypothetical protein [bacterium]
MLPEQQTHLHPLYHQITTLKRVVRVTYQADTYHMKLGVEHVDILRAGNADMIEELDRSNWEASASKFCHDLWIILQKHLYISDTPSAGAHCRQTP